MFKIVLVLLCVFINLEANASQNKAIYANGADQTTTITGHTINDVYLDRFNPSNLQANHLKNLKAWIQITRQGNDFATKHFGWEAMNYDKLRGALIDFKQSSTGSGISEEIKFQAQVGKIHLEKMDAGKVEELKKRHEKNLEMSSVLDMLFSSSSKEDLAFLDGFENYLKNEFNARDHKFSNEASWEMIKFVLQHLFQKPTFMGLIETRYSRLAQYIDGIREMPDYEDFIEHNKGHIKPILEKLKSNIQVDFDAILNRNPLLKALYPNIQIQEENEENKDEAPLVNLKINVGGGPNVPPPPPFGGPPPPPLMGKKLPEVKLETLPGLFKDEAEFHKYINIIRKDDLGPFDGINQGKILESQNDLLGIIHTDISTINDEKDATSFLKTLSEKALNLILVVQERVFKSPLSQTLFNKNGEGFLNLYKNCKNPKDQQRVLKRSIDEYNALYQRARYSLIEKPLYSGDNLKKGDEPEVRIVQNRPPLEHPLEISKLATTPVFWSLFWKEKRDNGVIDLQADVTNRLMKVQIMPLTPLFEDMGLKVIVDQLGSFNMSQILTKAFGSLETFKIENGPPLTEIVDGKTSLEALESFIEHDGNGYHLNPLGVAIRDRIKDAVFEILEEQTGMTKDTFYYPTIKDDLSDLKHSADIIPLLYWFFKDGLSDKLSSEGDLTVFLKDVPSKSDGGIEAKVREFAKHYFSERLHDSPPLYFLTYITSKINETGKDVLKKRVTMISDPEGVEGIEPIEDGINLFLFPKLREHSIPSKIITAFHDDYESLIALIDQKKNSEIWYKYKNISYYTNPNTVTLDSFGWNSTLKILDSHRDPHTLDKIEEHYYVTNALDTIINDLADYYMKLVKNYKKVLFDEELKAGVSFDKPPFTSDNLSEITSAFITLPTLDIRTKALQKLYEGTGIQDYLRFLYGFEESKKHPLYQSDNAFSASPFVDEIATGAAILFFGEKHPKIIKYLPRQKHQLN